MCLWEKKKGSEAPFEIFVHPTKSYHRMMLPAAATHTRQQWFDRRVAGGDPKLDQTTPYFAHVSGVPCWRVSGDLVVDSLPSATPRLKVVCSQWKRA